MGTDCGNDRKMSRRSTRMMRSSIAGGATANSVPGCGDSRINYQYCGCKEKRVDKTEATIGWQEDRIP